MDPSIKSLTITGSAVEDANKSRRPVGSRKKRQTKMEEEEFIEQAKDLARQSSPVVQQGVAPTAATAAVASVNVQIQKQEPVVRPIISIPTAKEPIAQAPVVHIREEKKEPEYDGGAKVILKPAKNPRVKLQPKHSSQSQTYSSGQSNHTNQPHTRKARRFRLSVSSLTHRFTRAKRVKDDMENKPIHKIREYLVQKGVIQEKSKAPEKMLRSMYKDFMLLKDTAL